MRRTKIIATIGPASDSPVVLDALIEAGMDVARLNSSHSGPGELEARLAAVRAAAARCGRQVAVMLDLAGPKLRVGEVRPGTRLEAGREFAIMPGAFVGDDVRVSLRYQGLARDVSPGDRLLLDDGAIELEVTETDGDVVRTRVLAGGALSSNKGVNAPGVDLGVRSLTAHDRDVVAWGIEAGVDLVAQSFVRDVSDVEELREIAGSAGVPLVSKIETAAAARTI
ncbi:MAG TPA: pyruvate kinase, partial [Coriobacteriia bacterium]|nr:pyruvate kinase [Coriobacteriia bacterium]